MYNEGLVAHVNYSTDSIARVEGRRRSRVILNSAVIVAVFYLL